MKPDTERRFDEFVAADVLPGIRAGGARLRRRRRQGIGLATIAVGT